MRRFGYPDRRGRPDRLNFGGIHRANREPHRLTKLQLVLDGFDPLTTAYVSTGSLLLIDEKGDVAAGWPFAKLMEHWKRKHGHAVYVPVQQRLTPFRQYRYGQNVLLAEGGEFRFLLSAIHEGNVYYDPGIKLEGASTSAPTWKQRSQFRVNSKDLPELYRSSRMEDACSRLHTPSYIAS